jgi:DNA-binding NarL/FixJ family response regulator
VTELRTHTLEELPALHPSLMSFLHAPLGNPVGAAAVDTPDALSDPAAAEATQAHFALIAPASPFVETVLQVLKSIDPDCRITQHTAVAEIPAGGLEKATFALIDVDRDDAGAETLVQELSAVTASPIVAMSEAEDSEIIDRILRAGAVGYLPKTYPAQLIEAVLRLIKGGERFRPHAADTETPRRGRPPKAARQSDSSLAALAGLTPRQRDVLLQLARGASNLDISRELNMREGTVKTHLFTIYRKLGVSNRAQAALYGMRMSELQQEQMQEAEKGKLDLSWLQPEMSHRRMKAGQWIFHQGDMGHELFYLQRGRVSFPEIGASIGAGEVFGEIGIFSPGHKRTCSARCETDVDLFTLSSGQVRRIYFGNPQFALFILTLVATRLADVRAEMVKK